MTRLFFIDWVHLLFCICFNSCIFLQINLSSRCFSHHNKPVIDCELKFHQQQAVNTVANCGESDDAVCRRDKGGFGEKTEGRAEGGGDENVWASLQEWTPQETAHVGWLGNECRDAWQREYIVNISVERCCWSRRVCQTHWNTQILLNMNSFVVLQCKILIVKNVNIFICNLVMILLSEPQVTGDWLLGGWAQNTCRLYFFFNAAIKIIIKLKKCEMWLHFIKMG